MRDRLPYTYDCYVQKLMQQGASEREESSIKLLRDLHRKYKEKDFLMSGKKVSIFSARKAHKEFVEIAVRDSHSLAKELGIENVSVTLASMFRLTTPRISQILAEKKNGKRTS